jgi:hypothetical protein
LGVLFVVLLVFLQDGGKMEIDPLAVKNQLAKECAALQRHHPHLHRMQSIQIKGNKTTIRLNFTRDDAKEENEEEEPSSPAKKAKTEWKHGDRVRKARECQNKCIGSSFTITH